MTSRSDDLDRRDHSDRQDWKANREHHARHQAYRRLAELRRVGYDEIMFSRGNSAHTRELKEMVAQLSFHRFDYEIVTFQEGGVDILFVSREAADLLDIKTRRNEVGGILLDGDFFKGP